MSALRKRLATSFQSEASIDSDNSFLNETDRNSNIDEEIRREIEKKYKRSSVNANYRFPRVKHKAKGSLSFSAKEPSPSSRIIRKILRPPRKHLRTTSEMSNYSPYMTRTPDLRSVLDRPVLRPVIRSSSKTKSSTPSPGRTLKFQKIKRLPVL
mmetsp:Transcript_13251/g.24844  ORF Transcript_13251/g.24844 Transcript_13251/m.24844 type:complete len:154 (-) Transcript_13251:1975-2436(-)